MQEPTEKQPLQVVTNEWYWRYLANALASSSRNKKGLQNSLWGTAPCVSTLCLLDVTACDQISQASPSIFVHYKQPSTGGGNRATKWSSLQDCGNWIQIHHLKRQPQKGGIYFWEQVWNACTCFVTEQRQDLSIAVVKPADDSIATL